jgi:hypothetical protein
MEYQQGALLPYDANIDFGGIHPKDLVRAMEKLSQTSRLTDNVDECASVRARSSSLPMYYYY